MSIFDEIKSDLKNGTPGPWTAVNAANGDIGLRSGAALPCECFADIRIAAEGALIECAANSRRIARVHDLERIALAAKELADVAYLALSMIDQDNLEAKAGWDALDIAATTALTAFREATQ